MILVVTAATEVPVRIESGNPSLRATPNNRLERLRVSSSMAKERFDDLDKSIPFGVGEVPRHSTSSLGAMTSSVAAFSKALGAGVLVTAVLTIASYFLSEAGAKNLSAVLFWPNALLQSAAPCVKVQGSVTSRVLCEGTPLNEVALLASFSLSVAVYSAIAYIIIRRRGRGGTLQ